LSEENINNFTVENVPFEYISQLKGNYAFTAAEFSDKFSTGCSDVYFNKSAFSSAKNLFYTIGHEFVHVSQNSVLSGLTLSQFGTIKDTYLKEFFAYRFENSIGSKESGGFDYISNYEMASRNPSLYKQLNYSNFSWTKNVNFVKRF
jgi:hypothetical protein